MKGKAIFAALICLLYSPVFVWLVTNWLSNPYYYHGFLVPVISGFVFWIRRDHLRGASPSQGGLLIFVAALALYATGFLLWILPLAALSLPIAIFGIIAHLCGMKRAMSFVFPVVFLIFMIPLPFVNSVSQYLQTITIGSSAFVVGLFGIPVITSGNQIELPNASFTIGTPCSGISSLISLLALATILAFLAGGPSWKRLILFLSAFPIAILANTLRVAVVLLIGDQWGYQAATSFFHEFSSLLLFLSAIALLLFFAWLLRLRFRTLKELSYG